MFSPRTRAEPPAIHGPALGVACAPVAQHLRGYEFTEYYLVVSKDRQTLVAIHAGTRPDSARAAYEALRRHAPDLPALTHVLVTHNHWHQVGGHAYFRSLEPGPEYYARAN